MNETRGTRYQRLRRRARAAALVSAAVVLATIALTPASQGLASAAHRMAAAAPASLHDSVALVAFVLIIVVIWEAAALPASLYGAVRVEARYARGRAREGGILRAQLQGGLAVALVAAPAAVLAAAIVMGAQRTASSLWWLVAGGVLAGVRGLALIVAPTLLARLARVRAIPRPDLAARLETLARRAGVPVASIVEWQIDDATTSALISGAGPSRRVFVAADVLREWTDDEISVVVAHELAHHRHHDLAASLALDATVLVTALAAAALALPFAARTASAAGDLSTLPFVAITSGAVWLAATPLRHALSRRQERRADEFALTLTGEAAAFSAAIRRLGEQHLVEERPSLLTRWLYYRHPTVAERLALAEAYTRARVSSS